MATPKQVLKSVGPKLVPFFKAVAIYFVLYIPADQPSFLAMVIKCLPIISLIAFVLLHGMSLGEEYTYSRRILLGLVFSLIGDALLIWEDFFVHGLGSFLVAQILYISAFGFRPFNVYAATVVYSFMALGISCLLPGTSGGLSIGMPIYTFFLMTMVWRAVARVQLFEELWTWTKLCSCVGGVLFAVSDAVIGFNAFCCRVPHSQALIMVSYYAAQLGISLSVVDSKASYLDALRDGQRAQATPTPTPTPALPLPKLRRRLVMAGDGDGGDRMVMTELPSSTPSSSLSSPTCVSPSPSACSGLVAKDRNVSPSSNSSSCSCSSSSCSCSSSPPPPPLLSSCR